MRRNILIIFIAVCVALLTSFTYHFSQQADINYYKGYRLFLHGNYVEAIPFYERSIEEGSLRKETFTELAYCYLWTGNSKKSIPLFKGIPEDKSDDRVKSALADAYAWNKKYSEAIDIFKKLIVTSDSSNIKEKLAEVYLWSGQPEKARIILRQLVREYPEDQKIKTMWGKALYYTGDAKEASRVFEGLLQENNE